MQLYIVKFQKKKFLSTCLYSFLKELTGQFTRSRIDEKKLSWFKEDKYGEFVITEQEKA